MDEDLGFAKWLVEQGLLTKQSARRARDAQLGRLGRLDTEIVDLGLLTERATLDALGKYHKTRTVSGAELEHASPAALRMVTSRIANRLGVVPFKLEGKTLSVATRNPGDLLVEDEIAQLTGCMVASFATLEIRFVEALNRYYQAPITARYAGLVRRLSGTGERPRAADVELGRARPTSPPTSARAPDRARPNAEGSRSSPPPYQDALELSADELELFPSFRGEKLEAATAEPGLADEVPLTRPGTKAPSVPRETMEIGPEALLEAAGHALQNVEMRDDIADAVLGFCAPLFRRRMMLVLRQGTILGWRGEGYGVDEAVVRAISVPGDEPSVFSGLLQGVEFWLGPLPSMPRNTDLVMALGGEGPKDCYILPIRVRDKVVCFLYGDNQDAGVGGLPLGELRRLAVKAGLAFQIYLIKGKIRSS